MLSQPENCVRHLPDVSFTVKLCTFETAAASSWYGLHNSEKGTLMSHGPVRGVGARHTGEKWLFSQPNCNTVGNRSRVRKIGHRFPEIIEELVLKRPAWAKKASRGEDAVLGRGNSERKFVFRPKKQTGPKIHFSTINQLITRVNRIEVVCLHSRTNVLFPSLNTYCLFFQTNRKGGYEQYDLGLIILFDFS